MTWKQSVWPVRLVAGALALGVFSGAGLKWTPRADALAYSFCNRLVADNVKCPDTTHGYHSWNFVSTSYAGQPLYQLCAYARTQAGNLKTA